MTPEKKDTFEDGLRRLEDVLDAIEGGDLGLEEALAKYEAGVGLYRDLTTMLRGAEEKVKVLTRDLGEQDFDEED